MERMVQTMPTRIGICAPARRLERETAEQVRAIAADRHPAVELVFHEQCFASAGHFAGEDALRMAALVELANDPGIDAVWFARGGYGSCRIAEDAVAHMGDAARGKVWLGYSDMGFLLAALFRAGIGRVAHGPMVHDVVRSGGAAATARALDWLVTGDAGAVAAEVAPGAPHAAFNLSVLAKLCGTPLLPDLAGHVVMVEEVSEHLYAIDRMLFQVTHALAPMQIAGLRLGRVSDVPENDVPFGEEPEAMVRRWCDRAGIAFLGGADIGHDAGNRVVPFG